MFSGYSYIIIMYARPRLINIQDLTSPCPFQSLMASSKDFPHTPMKNTVKIMAAS